MAQSASVLFTRPGRCLAAAAAVLAALVLAKSTGAGYPKPSPVPQSWELDFEPGPLRLYIDRPSGRAFWYFTYVVTNGSGNDRVWAPQFTLFTDAGEILESGEDVPPVIARDLIDLLGNDLLETQSQVIGDVFEGPEHARDGIVVWPARNLDVNEMSLFIAGISGETARVTHPMTGESLVLRKTLQRDYLIPGNAAALSSDPVELVSQRWILR